MLLFRVLAGALLLLHPAAARAQTVWDMATEYPQSAMPGLGVTTFAKHVAESSAGKLQIRPSFDASGGIRSAGMLAAIAEGRVQAGDAFAGALEAEDAIFALPSLPFLVTSIADARRLADLARPFLAAALQNKGQRLLYLTPWPPSGIWSKSPLKMPSDLTGLSIRTYDKTSSEVFASAGAKAASISFADTMPKLAEGSINAVLSSGDGGTGRRLWEFLPYFSEITYSLPLSVASVNQAIYDGLTPDLREAVDTARPRLNCGWPCPPGCKRIISGCARMESQLTQARLPPSSQCFNLEQQRRSRPGAPDLDQPAHRFSKPSRPANHELRRSCLRELRPAGA